MLKLRSPDLYHSAFSPQQSIDMNVNTLPQRPGGDIHPCLSDILSPKWNICPANINHHHTLALPTHFHLCNQSSERQQEVYWWERPIDHWSGAIDPNLASFPPTLTLSISSLSLSVTHTHPCCRSVICSDSQGHSCSSFDVGLPMEFTHELG